MKQNIELFFRDLSLALAAVLPFVVPFDPSRNIDAQGLLLLLAGASAWIALIIEGNLKFKSAALKWSIILFIVACILSFLFNPHKSYDLLGSPYIRLGSAGLIACVGIGLLTARLKVRQLQLTLYAICLLLAVSSVPYSWLRIHTLYRPGGVFSQADILAVYMGVGLLIGLKLWEEFKDRQKIVLLCQLLLGLALILSSTRSVLILIVILAPLWLNYYVKSWTIKRWLSYLVVMALLFGLLATFYHGRLDNIKYASQSLSYRYDLQSEALDSFKSKPILGYGAGNLADALSCSKLKDIPLQKTCHQNFFFNSSHDIFLDRFLGLGLIGGLAYLCMVVILLKKSLVTPKASILGFAGLLVAFYYLSNVTSVTLEVLFMVLLFGASKVTN
jgi:O-antigen ligase